MFNSTATNITAESLNTELEQVLNTANGTVGNSLVLGQIEGGRLFIIEGIDMGSNFNHIVPKWKYSVAYNEFTCSFTKQNLRLATREREGTK
jgi:hypothetical protein